MDDDWGYPHDFGNLHVAQKFGKFAGASKSPAGCTFPTKFGLLCVSENGVGYPILRQRHPIQFPRNPIICH
jgi:hypothetical protein